MSAEYKIYTIDKKIENQNLISDAIAGWHVVSITVHEGFYEVYMKRELKYVC